MLGYLIGGTLVITGVSLAVVIFSPFIFGYFVMITLFKFTDLIRDKYSEWKPVYQPVDDVHRRMVERNEYERKVKAEWEKRDVEKMRIEKEKSQRDETHKENKPIHIVETKLKEKPFNLRDGFFYVKDLTDDEINICKNNGFSELDTNPFGPGKGPRVLIRPPDNQSPVHYYFCVILKKEAEKYGKEATIYPSVRPDVVIFDKESIAFEVETGSHFRKRDLRAKFKRIKEDFSVYYILVTKWALRKAYQPYGNVITRSQIKETMARVFNNSALKSDKKTAN